MQHFWFQTTHPTNANASKSDHRKSHGTLGDHVTMIRSCNYLPSKEKLQRLLRMLPCTIVAFGVRNIRTDDATAKPNHHKLIRTNRRQRSHAEEALMPCGRLYSRISVKWLPRTAPRVIRRTTASQPQHGRHDHAPPQKGSGTCQANRRCDCFGAAMVIAVTSPLW